MASYGAVMPHPTRHSRDTPFMQSMKSNTVPLIVSLVLTTLLFPGRLAMGISFPGPVGVGFGALLVAAGSLPLVVRALRSVLAMRQQGGSPAVVGGPYRTGAEGSDAKVPRRLGYEIAVEVLCLAFALVALAALCSLLPFESYRILG